jgi:hypothetical protein
MKRWVWILLAVFLLIVGGVGWFGYSMYRYATVTVPNAYAQWGAAELVIIHMKLNNGAWPKSWDDLEPIDAAYNTHWNLYGGSDFKALKELIEIDWKADPAALRRASVTRDGDPNGDPPFRVIWRRDGGKSHWEGAEPNQMIADYFNPRLWIDPVRRAKD